MAVFLTTTGPVSRAGGTDDDFLSREDAPSGTSGDGHEGYDLLTNSEALRFADVMVVL
ncbi:hypothetical protein [Marinovum sp.]|uniref:hypothetical protein n=1 Tax=Marinovum sp. TaxID=2024839 RepID=UPI003A905AB6